MLYKENMKMLTRFMSTFDRKLKNNAFNDTLDMGRNIGQQLQLVDLQNNKIPSVTLGSGYQNTLM